MRLGDVLAFFTHATRQPAWRALARAKGAERLITIHDVARQYVLPLTRGTGCSIAALLAGAAHGAALHGAALGAAARGDAPGAARFARRGDGTESNTEHHGVAAATIEDAPRAVQCHVVHAWAGGVLELIASLTELQRTSSVTRT